MRHEVYVPPQLCSWIVVFFIFLLEVAIKGWFFFLLLPHMNHLLMLMHNLSLLIVSLTINISFWLQKIFLLQINDIPTILLASAVKRENLTSWSFSLVTCDEANWNKFLLMILSLFTSYIWILKDEAFLMLVEISQRDSAFSCSIEERCSGFWPAVWFYLLCVSYWLCVYSSICSLLHLSLNWYISLNMVSIYE